MTRLYITDMLRAQGRHISFHTPGHKRRGTDITELSYSDDLSDPKGVLALAEADAARILGADRSFFLTDGSTCGVYAMLYALRAEGVRRIAVPAYAHRSVANACEVLGLSPVLIAQDAAAGIPRQPTAEAVEAALRGADALLLTSPDYYGFFPDLAAARALCTAAGKPLLLDGAHGSHLHGEALHASRFADMWVDGVHKSLPAMTQGAVVSAKGAWAAPLAAGAAHFRTSSPSYPILASIEYALKFPKNARLERLAAWAKQQLGALPNDDWTKIVLPFGECADAAQRFLERRGVYAEFSDGNVLLCYLSPANKAREVKKLVRLLRDFPRGEMRFAAQTSDMAGGNVVLLPPEAAVGKVCARACGMVPPCIPLLLAGNVVTADAAARLARARHTFGLTDGKISVFAGE